MEQNNGEKIVKSIKGGGLWQARVMEHPLTPSAA